MTVDEPVLLAEVVDEHILVLTLNRPERRNAVNVELADRLGAEIERFDRDPGLWVCVLTGAGTEAFCAGMDMQEFTGRVADGQRTRLGLLETSNHPVVPTWKPLIAAINGSAVAGGWKIASRCDLRIAAETARIGVTENRWNLAAPFIADPGVFATGAIAAEVALMARPITADRAYQVGLVNAVVPAEELLEEALRWARHLCTLGQEAVRGHKKLLYYGRFAPPGELGELASDIFYWMGAGKPGVVVDSTVGPRAFKEKRQPDFTQMFHPARLSCRVCGTVYVVARSGERNGPACCGQALEEQS
ncbi:enoyl-CoA hydratase/isomerase family protein [Amycolatopsis thermoflava]|uniref:enoyl-CoA hydratase/isomerase family protein n=1 Tax=Amycolatopsis thermoflava TaxID=84480 RepID=UPI0038241977